MKLSKGLLGFGIGFASSILLYEATRNKKKSSHELIEIMKQNFNSDGKIIGSWICMVQEKQSTQHNSEEFVRGGLTVDKLGERHNYEFLLEPTNGDILKVAVK